MASFRALSDLREPGLRTAARVRLPAVPACVALRVCPAGSGARVAWTAVAGGDVVWLLEARVAVGAAAGADAAGRGDATGGDGDGEFDLVVPVRFPVPVCRCALVGDGGGGAAAAAVVVLCADGGVWRVPAREAARARDADGVAVARGEWRVAGLPGGVVAAAAFVVSCASGSNWRALVGMSAPAPMQPPAAGGAAASAEGGAMFLLDMAHGVDARLRSAHGAGVGSFTAGALLEGALGGRLCGRGGGGGGDNGVGECVAVVGTSTGALLALRWADEPPHAHCFDELGEAVAALGVVGAGSDACIVALGAWGRCVVVGATGVAREMQRPVSGAHAFVASGAVEHDGGVLSCVGGALHRATVRGDANATAPAVLLPYGCTVVAACEGVVAACAHSGLVRLLVYDGGAPSDRPGCVLEDLRARLECVCACVCCVVPARDPTVSHRRHVDELTACGAELTRGLSIVAGATHVFHGAAACARTGLARRRLRA